MLFGGSYTCSYNNLSHALIVLLQINLKNKIYFNRYVIVMCTRTLYYY